MGRQKRHVYQSNNSKPSCPELFVWSQAQQQWLSIAAFFFLFFFFLLLLFCSELFIWSRAQLQWLSRAAQSCTQSPHPADMELPCSPEICIRFHPLCNDHLYVWYFNLSSWNLFDTLICILDEDPLCNKALSAPPETFPRHKRQLSERNLFSQSERNIFSQSERNQFSQSERNLFFTIWKETIFTIWKKSLFTISNKSIFTIWKNYIFTI